LVGEKVTRKGLDLIKKFSDEFGKESDEAEINEDGNVIEPEDGADKKTDPYLEWYEKYNPSLKMDVMDDESNKKDSLNS